MTRATEPLLMFPIDSLSQRSTLKLCLLPGFAVDLAQLLESACHTVRHDQSPLATG